MFNQLLGGIKVLDFTQILSGPFATMLLGDAGADVVKVERPHTGDPTRQWGPPFVNGESVYFAAFNRGKQSVELDIKKQEDLNTLRELAVRADVVVENLRAGSLAKYGLGYDDLRVLNPRLIYVSIRGYAESSPHSKDAGLEVILEAESGLMSITGPGEGGSPVRLGVAAIDMMTGLLAVSSIYSALYQRERTGSGTYVSVSLEETAALMMTHPWLMHLIGNTEYQPMGSQHPSIAPYEIFATKDKPLMLGAIDDAQFAKLATALGCPEWTAEPEWETNGRRVEHRVELHQAIENKLLAETAMYWREKFSDMKLPVGVVESVSSAATKWFESNAPRLTAHHPEIGNISWPTSVWRKEGGEVVAPPSLGNATDRVVTEWLEGTTDNDSQAKKGEYNEVS